MIITMAFHPSGHITSAQLPNMIRMLILVHGLALACIPVMFLGTWGLSRRMVTPSRLECRWTGALRVRFGRRDGCSRRRRTGHSQSARTDCRLGGFAVDHGDVANVLAVYIHLEPGIRAGVRGGVFGGNHRLVGRGVAQPDASAWRSQFMGASWGWSRWWLCFLVIFRWMFTGLGRLCWDNPIWFVIAGAVLWNDGSGCGGRDDVTH